MIGFMTASDKEGGFPGKPAIATAIPRRRYRLGEFTLIVLGDIESRDGIDYSYIMAVIRGQDPEPGIYITAERAVAGGALLNMRIIMRDGNEVVGSSGQWRDLDAFVGEATRVITRVLNLNDETPYQMM